MNPGQFCFWFDNPLDETARPAPACCPFLRHPPCQRNRPAGGDESPAAGEAHIRQPRQVGAPRARAPRRTPAHGTHPLARGGSATPCHGASPPNPPCQRPLLSGGRRGGPLSIYATQHVCCPGCWHTRRAATTYALATAQQVWGMAV